MKYFTDKEFKCKDNCGGGIEKMNATFLISLDKIRDIVGMPLTLISAYRCPAHNKAVGSISDNHPKGYAVDIRCLASTTRYKIITAALKVGITRIGVHKDFVHLDRNLTAPQGVVWVY